MDCATVRELAPEFVLGTLDAGTAARLRDHLAMCPEEHAELAGLGGVVPYLAESLEPVEPRPQLKARLLEAARSARPLTVVPGAASSTSRSESPSTRAPWLPSAPVAWAFTAAALILVAVLGATALTLRGQLDESRRTADLLGRAMAAATEPGALVARMTGSEQAPAVSGLAVVSHDGAVLVLEGLPPAPADRYYEAWYIVGGSPRSAGTVELQPNGTGLLAGPSAAGPIDEVAVTLEPVGGTPAPEGQFYATGMVVANPG
jgi:anti-sigma-K factor RskA